MELSSTLSTNEWNKSQSVTESVACGVAFARAVRSRVLSTRACREKIIVVWYRGQVGGKWWRSSE